MDSLFDQDSAPDAAPSVESPPIRGAGAATLGQGEAESAEEERAEKPGAVDQGRDEPDGSDPVGPKIDARDDADTSAAADGAHPTPNTTEAPAAGDRTGDGETGSVEVPPAPGAPGAGEETLDGSDDHAAVASLAEQVDAGGVERDEEHASLGEPEPVPTETLRAPPLDPDATPDPPVDATAPPAWHLPPPPKAVPEPATAWAPPAPAAPPEVEVAPPPTTLPPDPFTPAAQAANVVSPAPSSAGPPPASIESRRLAPSRLGRRLASRLRLLARWPAPVRATPDQRGSSLVMLFLLAVTIGVVGAAVLVGLVFLVISTLGHGSGG